MTRARTFLRRLRDDQSGAYLVEFAVVMPVFLILTMGSLDLGHTLYTKSVLEGAVQKAARDSALEDAADTVRQTAVDDNLKAAVKQIQPFGTVTIDRKTFKDFSTAKTHKETYVEANGNNVCDNGEKYFDTNNSGVWDNDTGTDGQGGAKDVTVYTATLTYQRMFPVSGLLGMSSDVTMTAKAILANQPYSDQVAPRQGTCP